MSIFLVVPPEGAPPCLLCRPGGDLLHKLQVLVGGYFEVVSRDDANETRQPLDCYVNENGIAMNLPTNRRAQGLLVALGFPPFDLRGTCVIAGLGRREDFEPFTSKTVSEFQTFFVNLSPSPSLAAPSPSP